MLERAKATAWILGGAVLVFALGPLVVWLLAQPLSRIPSSSVDLARAAACVLCAGVLVVARPVFRRRARWGGWLVLGVLLLCVGAAVSTVDTSLRGHLGTTRQVSTWNFFHYYLGSKYFKELGYDGLYEEALKADQQGHKRFRNARYYRDMKTYGMKRAGPVRHAPRRAVWTRERWRAFKRDVATIGRLESRRFWVDPLRDRGFNPPPGWTLLGGTAAKLADPRNPLESGLLMCIDPGLLLLAFALSVRTYGLFRSLLALLGMALWVGSYRLFGGKLVQYDWLAALWASLCCMRRERWLWAGAFAAYATSVRIFPGGVMLGALACALFQARQQKHWSVGFTKLFGGGAVALLLLVLVSSVACGRGPSAWLEFKQKSALHQTEHKFNETRIGLPYLTTASVESGIDGRVKRKVREENYDKNRLLRWGVQGLLVGLLLLAARRSDVHDAAILGLVLVFALAVSSRYYGAMYGLLLLRGAMAAPRAPPDERVLSKAFWHRALAGGPHRAVRWLDVAFFAVLAFSYVPGAFGADNRTVYMLSNVALMAYLVVLLVQHARGKEGACVSLGSSPEQEPVASNAAA